jgi:hypothetical protein
VYQKYRAKYVENGDHGDWIWYYQFSNDHYASLKKLSSPQPNVATVDSGAETDPKADDKRTKNIIRDMLKDGITTSTNDLSFKIGTDEFVVNYQKQPDAVYQKYRTKYVATQYKGSEDWIWFYQFDTHKWDLMVAHKPTDDQHQTDTTTGVFKGKENQ